jgi:GntR family transcriptional regulator
MRNWTELIKIDRQAKVPLYHQISQNLRVLIGSGELKPGEMVPSEWDLSELYGVSRLTVRRALDELSREGWLTRRHGVGTFVANPTMAQIAPSQLGFTQKMRQIGRTPSSRLVSIKTIPATDEVATHLGLEEGTLAAELVRVRLADGEPIMLETAYLPQERFPDLSEANLGEGSLYEFLSERYQVTVVAVDQTLEPILLTAQEALLLDTEPGAPALLSEVVAFTSDDTPVEYSWSVTRGDKCKFYFRFREGSAEEG